jgi:hypothetical protein
MSDSGYLFVFCELHRTQCQIKRGAILPPSAEQRTGLSPGWLSARFLFGERMTWDYRSQWGLAPKDKRAIRCRCGSRIKALTSNCAKCRAENDQKNFGRYIGRVAGEIVARGMR